MHTALDEQDTPVRKLWAAGLGEDWMLQLLPSQLDQRQLLVTGAVNVGAYPSAPGRERTGHGGQVSVQCAAWVGCVLVRPTAAAQVIGFSIAAPATVTPSGMVMSWCSLTRNP